MHDLKSKTGVGGGGQYFLFADKTQKVHQADASKNILLLIAQLN